MADGEFSELKSIDTFVRRYRRAALVVADCFLWCVALVAATALRYNLAFSDIRFGGVASILPWVVGAQVVSGLAFGLYLGRWRLASFDEATALAGSTAITTAVAVVVDLWLTHPRMIPLGATIGGGVGAFVLMGSLRYGWRLLVEWRRRGGSGEGSARTLVFGAGEGGYQAILVMRSDPGSPYYSKRVGLLDIAALTWHPRDPLPCTDPREVESPQRGAC